MVIAILMLILSGCSNQTDATIVAVMDEPKCAHGKLTVIDTERFGRLQRCGYWGKVGETFHYNIFN